MNENICFILKLQQTSHINECLFLRIQNKVVYVGIMLLSDVFKFGNIRRI